MVGEEPFADAAFEGCFVASEDWSRCREICELPAQVTGEWKRYRSVGRVLLQASTRWWRGGGERRQTGLVGFTQ
jgi:hypothetical protein